MEENVNNSKLIELIDKLKEDIQNAYNQNFNGGYYDE